MLRQWIFYSAIIIFAAVLVGCSESPSQSNKKEAIDEAMAQLSPDEREVAQKQKLCPVAGKPLGAMGVPKKVRVEGHDVFICCKGCEQSLKSNPEKYLKKLGHSHSDSKQAINEALNKLATKDRAAALQQKICPVTEQPLGSMGVPKKITFQGQDIFVCCKGCIDKVTAEPEKYLKKLK